MADKHAYSKIALNGDFSEDGEYFLVTMDLNGTPIRFGTVYVGDQREAFQAAADKSKKPQDSSDEPPAS